MPDLPAKFTPGDNLAIKTPPELWESTIAFYENTLGFERVPKPCEDTVAFKFGDKTLWVDRSPNMSQAEIWLEIVTNDTTAAAELLKSGGAVRCDEIEPLPEDFDALWIKNPAGIVHLISGEE